MKKVILTAALTGLFSDKQGLILAQSLINIGIRFEY